MQRLRLYSKPTESESAGEQDPQGLCVRAQVPEERMAGRELEGWDRFYPCISPALPREGPLLLKIVKAGPVRTGNLVIRTNGSQNGK